MRSRSLWAMAMLSWILLPLATLAQDNRLPDAVSAALARAKIPQAGFSLVVQELGKNQPLLAFNADTPRNPASTIKLLTTYLALESLGPTFKWKTSALAHGQPQGGVLEGDLYLRGDGDPFLVLERYWLLIRELRLRGVREIRGDLVIDNGYFDMGSAAPGDFDGRPYDTYNVIPDALLVNFQAVNFLFRPDVDGRRVEIIADPLPANLRIRNQVQLVDGKCGGDANRINFTVESLGGRDQVTFTGRFSRQCREYRVSRSLMQAPEYAYGLFRTLWEESGGSIRGGFRRAAVPAAGMQVLAELDSVPLREVIAGVNKYSNNVMARHLLLTLGAQRFGAPATLEKGQLAAREELVRLGLVFPELEIGNGAGLARETRISAASLNRLLLVARAGRYGAEFEASLALAGMDGTARRRFRAGEFAGYAHLKTGTLNNVSALTGYVHTPGGRRFAVTMIQNAPGWGEEVQQAVLRWVMRQP
ncbi:MAG: D-alanyl-D-alanine carboxypeptidase/D-alanyl-D-alanine-endopeptidase [Gammaproteobacteria bacterium]|nr:D-alanyl-D-alanine carboxypeptidase/D-alanyl-D-alanine-endopeptidase [Gammaproteobacteria bacterium]